MTEAKGTGCKPQAHGDAEPLTRAGPCQLCGRPRCWRPIRHGERRGRRCGHNPIPGGKTCVFHGSNHAKARAAGRRRQEERRLSRTVLGGADVEPVTDPVRQAQLLAGRYESMIGELERVVGSLTDSDGKGLPWTPELQARLSLLRQVLRDAAKLAEAMSRLDVMGRAVALEERHRDLMVELMGLALDGILEGLKAGALRLLVDVDGASAVVERGWPVLVGEIVPAEIRRLEAGGSA